MIELTLISIALLTFLVCVPTAIQSCIYLKMLWDHKKHRVKKSQPSPPESSVVRVMNESDTIGEITTTSNKAG